jgi:hypothetical protein
VQITGSLGVKAEMGESSTSDGSKVTITAVLAL